jgi:hypothetical protein
MFILPIPPCISIIFQVGFLVLEIISNNIIYNAFIIGKGNNYKYYVEEEAI